jgi:hypothetical protein
MQTILGYVRWGLATLLALLVVYLKSYAQKKGENLVWS